MGSMAYDREMDAPPMVQLKLRLLYLTRAIECLEDSSLK